MLQSEPEKIKTPAAQVRVTPQELAAALARLEARQGGLDGTIPLGDAVQELGLNATPEELLREIEAGRAQQQQRPPRTRGARLLRVGMSGLAAGVLVVSALFAVRSAPAPAPPVAAVIAPAVPQAAPSASPTAFSSASMTVRWCFSLKCRTVSRSSASWQPPKPGRSSPTSLPTAPTGR